MGGWALTLSNHSVELAAVRPWKAFAHFDSAANLGFPEITPTVRHESIQASEAGLLRLYVESRIAVVSKVDLA